jgi:ElaB/YqjD/DUF883 family membrane-anchored ribosome-binding protein
MAEERNVGLQRAPEAAGETDATKAELQRRMEEARESITQTVTEIKETVVNQYQQVRESINDTLDWREQYRRRPVHFALGAFGAGLLLGYSVGGVFGGRSDEEFDGDESEAFDRITQGFDRMSESPRPYAASPILGGTTGSSAHRAAPSAAYAAPQAEQSAGGADADVGPDTRPSYSTGYQAPTASASPEASFAGLASSGSGGGESAQEEAPKGPGLFERFKETKAYDRLQEELSTLGDRAIEELSRTARTVVVPALISKLKDMIGIDLSTQQQGAQRSRPEQPTTSSSAAAGESQTSSGQSAGATTGGSAASAAGGTSL